MRQQGVPNGFDQAGEKSQPGARATGQSARNVSCTVGGLARRSRSGLGLAVQSVMFVINDRIAVDEGEFQWSFVRSGGPGGQNVNKVASKAVLRWDVAGSPSLPPEVKARLRTLQRRRITKVGELVLSSQRYRDQERNKAD